MTAAAMHGGQILDYRDNMTILAFPTLSFRVWVNHLRGSPRADPNYNHHTRKPKLGVSRVKFSKHSTCFLVYRGSSKPFSSLTHGFNPTGMAVDLVPSQYGKPQASFYPHPSKELGDSRVFALAQSTWNKSAGGIHHQLLLD